MVVIALWLFGIGALIGVVLASRVLRGRFAPWPLSLAGALSGLAGLVLLIIALNDGTAIHQVMTALVALLLAALGGLVLAGYHLRGRIPPKAIVFGHAILAAYGFVTLLSLAI